jgi:hypothetical protein
MPRSIEPDAEEKPDEKTGVQGKVCDGTALVGT